MSLARMPHWFVLLPSLVACAAAAPSAPPHAPRAAALPAPSPREGAEEARAPLDPETALGTADAIDRDQLAVGVRDERFAVDRQVAELRKAIELYRRFVERAEGDPRFTEAVRRSEARIDDAQKTIDFLLEGASRGRR